MKLTHSSDLTPVPEPPPHLPGFKGLLSLREHTLWANDGNKGAKEDIDNSIYQDRAFLFLLSLNEVLSHCCWQCLVSIHACHSHSGWLKQKCLGICNMEKIKTGQLYKCGPRHIYGEM